MTENPATQQSMLAKHRVIPYHFKGFNEAQKAEILNEREMQMRERDMLAKSEKEQEKLWAQQQAHLRRLQVIEDRKYKKSLREVQAAQRATQEQQAYEQKIANRDRYNEKVPAFESK